MNEMTRKASWKSLLYMKTSEASDKHCNTSYTNPNTLLYSPILTNILVEKSMHLSPGLFAQDLVGFLLLPIRDSSDRVPCNDDSIEILASHTTDTSKHILELLIPNSSSRSIVDLFIFLQSDSYSFYRVRLRGLCFK
jgi:hypothetical protein